MKKEKKKGSVDAKSSKPRKTASASKSRNQDLGEDLTMAEEEEALKKPSPKEEL